MKQNVGGMDRTMRWIVGGIALTSGLFGRMSTPWRIGAFTLAASELITAATRYCPINQALGITSNPEAMRKRQTSQTPSQTASITTGAPAEATQEPVPQI